jgi:hypothetical protein
MERLSLAIKGKRMIKSAIPVIRNKPTSSKKENAIRPHQLKHVKATKTDTQSATVSAYDT